MTIERDKIEKIAIGAAFTIFVMVALYKLTNASLWFDEAIEYWYSKVLIGPLPFSDSANMYERITSTFQPPLYNVIMFFWLKISSAQWWFRFFGVVMGFIGALGIFSSIKKLTDNKLIAAGGVTFTAFVYILVYYWQECAEYSLLIGVLCWTFYFWVRLLKDVNRKNIIWFTVFAIIPVYCHYGAAFPVFSMAVFALVEIIIKKDKKHILEVIIAYIGALAVAGIPLYLFFLKKQMENMQGGSTFSGFNFGSGIIGDCFSGSYSVFTRTIGSYYSAQATKVVFALILILFVIMLIKGRKVFKYLVLMNILTWLLFYFAVKSGIYSYGNYVTRYCLFFVPLWIITDFAVCYEFIRIITPLKIVKKWSIHHIITGILIAFGICFCICEWNLKLIDNWEKEDNRSVVQAWDSEEAYESSTLVYYGACPGFAYYIRQTPGFTEEKEENIKYMFDIRNATAEEYKEYLDEYFGTDSWPDTVYLAASHIGTYANDSQDFRTLMSQFTQSGYEREDIFDNNGSLIKMTRNTAAEHLTQEEY